jgi:hypothetical protein
MRQNAEKKLCPIAYQNNSQDDGQDSGGHVVGHGSTPDLAAQAQIQRSDAGNQRRDNQRDDDAFQHLQKQFSDVRHVHGLTRGPPGLLGLLALEDDAQRHAGEHSGQRDQGQRVLLQASSHFGSHFLTLELLNLKCWEIEKCYQRQIRTRFTIIHASFFCRFMARKTCFAAGN